MNDKEKLVDNLVSYMKDLFIDNYELYIGKKEQGLISYYDYDAEWEILKDSSFMEENHYFNRLVEVNPKITKCYSVEEAWGNLVPRLEIKVKQLIEDYETHNLPKDIDSIIDYYDIC